ncbi:MAG: hypothetical protein K9N23_06910 [Akkermansiaceae bacterium]|nr:hypothetical protein [Akkermansiaceae bacterium]
MWRRFIAWFLLVALCWVLPSCGLIRAPFRIAGAVVDSGYRAGKKLVGKTAEATKRDPKTKTPEKNTTQQDQPNPAEPDPRTSGDDQAADTLPGAPPGPGVPLPAPDLPAAGPIDALPPLPEELPPL